MLRENDIKNVRKLFNRHHYVITTAELLEAKEKNNGRYGFLLDVAD